MSTLNERAWHLCDAMVADADALGISVKTLSCGTRLIDCGVRAPGNIEAGLRLAEVCMSGLGSVEDFPEKGGRWSLDGQSFFDPSPLYESLGTKYLVVASPNPIAACMASQYAGWQVTGENFFAMGSGPMRAAAGREEIFDVIGHRERVDRCVGVLECGKLPPESVSIDIAQKCNVTPDRLTLLVARTASTAGTTQIVARSLETALHKLHVLGFDLSFVKAGWGMAPIPPTAGDDLTAIGWTNDAILYGGSVILDVSADERTIDEFGPRVPSSSSSDYGRPFAEIFTRYGGDFYRIDPMLFSPAEILFYNMDSPVPSLLSTEKTKEMRFTWDQFGFSDDEPRAEATKVFQFGALAPHVLKESFSKK
jgi:methenyltetrahydromethanopterin cyclohydrolase